jgi:methylated-DNA-protein-cysteine methyltransferase-like protein
MSDDIVLFETIPYAERVYDVVAKIPYGRVTTYGDIARSLGSIRGARMVGWALNSTPEGRDLPAHRVVNRIGELSGGWHFGHPEVMKSLLVAEGVPFRDEYQVDLKQCRWLPWEDEDSSPADEVDDFNSVPIPEDGLG